MTIKEAERIVAEESEFYERSRIGILESRASPVFDFSDNLGWYMLTGFMGCIGAFLMWVFVYYPLLFG